MKEEHFPDHRHFTCSKSVSVERIVMIMAKMKYQLSKRFSDLSLHPERVYAIDFPAVVARQEIVGEDGRVAQTLQCRIHEACVPL